MKGRVDVGAMGNRGASATMHRPGNSAAEKIKAFSGSNVLPAMTSLPVTNNGTNLNIRGPPASHYQMVNRLDAQKTSSSINNAHQIDINVYIGNSNSAQDWDWLKSQRITCIVNTAEEIPNYFSDQGLRYLNLSLKDNPTPGGEDLFQVLERTYRYIAGVIKFDPNTKILVHCHMGKSRSASIVIYYLMRSRGWGYDEALEFAKSKRPIVAPNMWYAKQLRDAERLIGKIRR